MNNIAKSKWTLWTRKGVFRHTVIFLDKWVLPSLWQRIGKDHIQASSRGFLNSFISQVIPRVPSECRKEEKGQDVAAATSHSESGQHSLQYL